MKNFLLVTIVTILLLPAAACRSRSDPAVLSDNVTTLRLAEIQTEGYPTTMADYEFARLVNERTNGRVNIVVFTDGQLGDEVECIEQIEFGGIDFTRISAAHVAGYSTDLNVLLLPYLYRDSEHMWKVLNGPIGQKILADLSSARMVGLAWYDAGSRNFYTSEPITKIEDLKGRKIRVQDNKMMLAMISALGANAIILPFGDVYGALQTGVIEGAENNWPSYESLGHYEVAKYFLLDGHNRVPEILIGSQVSLSKLSAEDQAIIKEVAKETQAFEIKAWKEREKESEDIVKSRGATVTELSPEELQKFSDAMAPVYEEFAKGYEDLLQQIHDTE